MGSKILKAVFYCWDHSHKIEVDKNIKSTCKKVKAGKLVCPEDGSRLVHVYGYDVIFPRKPYTCKNGHLTLIGAFKKGLSISYGPEQRVNEMEFSAGDLEELVSSGTIACRRCGSPLSALDDYVLTPPEVPSVKTRVRVGDVWDKHGTPEPRKGDLDENLTYRPSEFEKRNAERLKSIRRKRSGRVKEDGIEKRF